MGTYLSVRGWIECPEGCALQVKEIIASFVNQAANHAMDTEQARLYNQGWVIPDSHINWTHYIFYGADIRAGCLIYLKAQFQALAASVQSVDGEEPAHLTGIIHVDHEEGTERHVWTLAGGMFHEATRPPRQTADYWPVTV